MGRWEDAADSVQPRVRTCAFQRFIQSIDDADELLAALATKATWAEKRAVIIKGGGPAIDTQTISRHFRGQDKCPTAG